MDIRALLLGLGSGMLAATVIIGVGEALSPDSSQLNVPAVPQQQGTAQETPAVDWAKAAKEAGMVVLSQTEFEQKIAQAKTDGAKAKEVELVNKQPAPSATIRVYIQSGMGTKDVGQLLNAAGVIGDVNEFVAARQNHNSPIRAGIYELRVNMTPQEVFKVVATVP